MGKAFTLIELIFVIVVLGILISIAIPKITATRDDAIVSGIITNTRTMLGDISAFYTAQGNARWRDSKITNITDVPLYTDSSCQTYVDENTQTSPNIFYLCSHENGTNVITFETFDEGKLSIKSHTGDSIANTVSIDKSIKALANGPGIGKIYIIGGNTVTRN